MKKYFAKYLPVEGEIKMGDYYLNHKVNHITQRSDGSMDKAYIGFKKVKLFLCSRDIQVGDDLIDIRSGTKCKLQKKVGGIAMCINEENPDGFSIAGTHLKKVIGEISPEAIWVKEGDEFDEEEWKLCTIYRDGRFIEIGKDATLDSSERYGTKVKGPCGHFH